MDPVRRLLAPIDFSSASKTVVNYVLNEEQHKDDHLILMHSYRLIPDEDSDYRDSPLNLRETLENQLLENYQSFNQDLLSADRQPKVEFRMEVGFIVNCIYTICKESEIDLILYGIKANKENQILADLIGLGCAPVMLIPELYDWRQGADLEVKDISKSNFKQNWSEYLSELEANPSTSFRVLP